MRKVVILALALLCAPAGLSGQALHPDSLFPRLIGRRFDHSQAVEYLQLKISGTATQVRVVPLAVCNTG